MKVLHPWKIREAAYTLYFSKVVYHSLICTLISDCIENFPEPLPRALSDVQQNRFMETQK